MEDLILEKSKYTPEVIFKEKENTLTIKGKSYMENTFEFYKPIVKWIEEYFKLNIETKTTINFELIYFNSSSSVQLFDIFDIVEDANNEGQDIEVNWFYNKENDIALESGEDYKEDFEGLNFNLIAN